MIKPPKDVVENVKQSLGEFAEYAKPEFTQRRDWGKIDFARIQGTIDEVCEQAANLWELPLDLLPMSQFQQVKDGIDRLATIFSEIDSFDVTAGGDPTVRREDIASRFELEAEQFFYVFQQYVPYLALRRGSQGGDASEALATTDQLKALLGSAREESADRLRELEEITFAARAAAPDAAIPEFALGFEHEARRAARDSRMWLAVVGSMYLYTIAGIIWMSFLAPIDVDSSSVELLHHFALKLPLVAVALTGVFWCSRHYSVAKQQVIVSRHRVHAIRTFRAFAAAAHEPDTRDAVLTQAMECVFVHVPTGLTRQEGSPSNQVSVDLGKALDRR